APACTSSIIGFGPFGYHLAMVGMIQVLSEINAIRAAQQGAPQE
ncbi:MAG: 3-dehydroquinate dehydratase, partial [Campylobacterota bacterium]|nr:3-dehydroquinate dehydratase [Campylobacterota bacterium]